jgi:hypothetical protein
MATNWTQIEQSLSGVLNVVTQIAPLAAVAGPEGAAIAGMVVSATKLAQSVLTALENTSTPPPAETLASIQASAASIQQINDGLAEQVADS